jgi:uncharacterized protein YndB with AHSA1/START domain
MTERTATHATFVLERVYEASPERVFAAWGDPVSKNRWFANLEDGAAPTMEVDFRIGGTERNVFVNKVGGPTFTYDAEFRDIVPNERIVLTNYMHRDEDRISVSVVSVEFTPEGDGTRLTLTDHGVYLDGLDNAHWREEGTAFELDRLVDELKNYGA